MKIYIASSWKNAEKAKAVAVALRLAGNEVDCFCDPSTGRSVFSFKELDPIEGLDQIHDGSKTKIIAAFNEDRFWIDWADAVVLVLPAGNSSHLEAGYAVGAGKLLLILGDFPKGQLDVMYGFANGLHRTLEGLIAGIEEAKAAAWKNSPWPEEI